MLGREENRREKENLKTRMKLKVGNNNSNSNTPSFCLASCYDDNFWIPPKDARGMDIVCVGVFMNLSFLSMSRPFNIGKTRRVSRLFGIYDI